MPSFSKDNINYTGLFFYVNTFVENNLKNLEKIMNIPFFRYTIAEIIYRNIKSIR